MKKLFSNGWKALRWRVSTDWTSIPRCTVRHIVVMFDVALLRQEIKELQEGISYRRQRAPAEHRGLYDVLEENLVAGNQELEDDMDFFTTSERKE
jgi:hypothetical protein